jgi:hypothetical protein
MKSNDTKTQSRPQFDFDTPRAPQPLARSHAPSEPQRTVESLVGWHELPIVTKPFDEIAVTLRARADGMVQACRCGGTGEDGCVIDGPLVQRDPQRGFPSHSTLALRGNGGNRG